LAYLRFTPEEYRAICLRCRDLDLCEEFFPAFQAFLAEALSDAWPILAARIVLLGKRRVRLLFEHLRTQQCPPAKAAVSGKGHGLSFEEFLAVARAALQFPCCRERRPAFRGFLVHYFKEAEPTLAGKLEQLPEPQIVALYERARKPERWGA